MSRFSSRSLQRCVPEPGLWAGVWQLWVRHTQAPHPAKGRAAQLLASLPVSVEAEATPWLWPFSPSLVCPSNTVSSPNANFLLRCGRFSPFTKVGHGEEPWCGCIFAAVSQGPSVQAQHTWDQPPGQGAGCPVQPPRPHHRRAEMLGCRQSQEAVAGQAFQGRA